MCITVDRDVQINKKQKKRIQATYTVLSGTGREEKTRRKATTSYPLLLQQRAGWTVWRVRRRRAPTDKQSKRRKKKERHARSRRWRKTAAHFYCFGALDMWTTSLVFFFSVGRSGVREEVRVKGWGMERGIWAEVQLRKPVMKSALLLLSKLASPELRGKKKEKFTERRWAQSEQSSAMRYIHA